MDDVSAPGARRNPHLVRNAIVSLILIVGIGGFVFLFATGESPKNTAARPQAVENVSPEGGNLDLRQATISADLAPGYQGYLEIDGIEVPGDDLQRVDALNTITLRPTEDSAYRQLAPGRHCAAVVYRPINTTREDPAAATYQWCFSLH
ncbi:MAG TPA: hypothetical protein VM121_08280 [Acidimicrobiales bacterium]|nr:hypothetical protein [Acidimicrobiales bacterium]